MHKRKLLDNVRRRENQLHKLLVTDILILWNQYFGMKLSKSLGVLLRPVMKQLEETWA